MLHPAVHAGISRLCVKEGRDNLLRPDPSHPKRLLGYWWGKPRIHHFHNHRVGNNSRQLPPMPRPCQGAWLRATSQDTGLRESDSQVENPPGRFHPAPPGAHPGTAQPRHREVTKFLLQNRERQVQCLSSRLWVQCFRRVFAASSRPRPHPLYQPSRHEPAPGSSQTRGSPAGGAPESLTHSEQPGSAACRGGTQVRHSPLSVHKALGKGAVWGWKSGRP